MSPRTMIENSPIAAVVTDPNLPDNPIIECNAAFMHLTGYDRNEIVGRNCRFLNGTATEPERLKKIRVALEGKRPVLLDLLNYRKDGTEFRNAVMIVPLFDDTGNLQFFLGSQVELPEDHDGISALPLKRNASRERLRALTPRQREILVQMSGGKLNKQIAYDLGLSERTIKMHRAALFRALGVKTSADAIRIAVEAGL